MKIILIDNYDSFTFNLYHYLSKYSHVDVIRNDKIDSAEIVKKKYTREELLIPLFFTKKAHTKNSHVPLPEAYFLYIFSWGDKLLVQKKK